MKKTAMILALLLFLSACSNQQGTSGNDVSEENPSEEDISGENPLEEDVSGKNPSGVDGLENDLPGNYVYTGEMPEQDYIDWMYGGDGGDPCGFLKGPDWEGKNPSCEYMIEFSFSTSFDNWIFYPSSFYNCQSASEFRYNELKNELYIFNFDGELLDIGNIIYVDDYYFVLTLWGSCYTYENVDAELPGSIVSETAQKNVGTDKWTKPRLRISGYGEGTVSVFMCDYDQDESEAKVWTLNLSEDCAFKSVEYSASSDTVEETVLEKSDYESVPEKYADGFFAFNADGEVISVIFYED